MPSSQAEMTTFFVAPAMQPIASETNNHKPAKKQKIEKESDEEQDATKDFSKDLFTEDKVSNKKRKAVDPAKAVRAQCELS